MTLKCEATTRAAPRPAHGPERRGDHRHRGEVVDRELPPGDLGHVGEAELLELLDAAPAAGAVDEPDERDPQLVREPLRVNRLAEDRRVGGAAPDGEVVALDRDPAAVDPPPADDDVGRREGLSSPSAPYSPTPAIAPVSWKVPRVQQPLDPLADGQPARWRAGAPRARRRRARERAPRGGEARRSRPPSPPARCYFAPRWGGARRSGPGATFWSIDLDPERLAAARTRAPALRRGLIVAIPVGVAMLLDLELDAPASGAISTGALLAGFVAFDAPARTRLVWQLSARRRSARPGRSGR